VFLRLVAKMSGRFLEQRINIKFYVKLGENATDTCAMLSEAYGGEALTKSCVLERPKRFKRVASTWKMMKEVVVRDLTEPMRTLKKCGIWCVQVHV
jgi:hypothetical protein